ncbi:VOC family protein [Pandoraea anhela]|uniref:Lactoylglutathione lyase n=1 Tax=Pandoraea anhela TaxID=2508295 RepID=A0A5E4VMW1_9BURK|nr:VOC family protein [Pandoraea anhela]VVE12839.1 lactoylglutathione lyase [Pandoraea anhela]
MPIPVSRLILYVRDVERLKSFYQQYFALAVVEEIAGEWVVLNAGAIELALHLVRQPYRQQPPSMHPRSNAKIVFSVTSGLTEMRERLLRDGVRMRDLKRFDGFPFLMCDGEDPEGNVFQLAQAD